MISLSLRFPKFRHFFFHCDSIRKILFQTIIRNYDNIAFTRFAVKEHATWLNHKRAKFIAAQGSVCRANIAQPRRQGVKRFLVFLPPTPTVISGSSALELGIITTHVGVLKSLEFTCEEFPAGNSKRLVIHARL